MPHADDVTPEQPEAEEPEAEEPEAEVQLSRAERRAAARGKTQPPKIAGPAGSRLRQPPPAKRNYAARKGG